MQCRQYFEGLTVMRSRGASRQCWEEWDRDIFRRKQRRTQELLGVGQRHFSEETEAYPGNAGSGADTFLGANRGVSR